MNLGTLPLHSIHPSHPKIYRAPSKTSIAASDDYYSFSDYASDLSSHNDHSVTPKWQTPPSRNRSNPESQENIQSETTLPNKPMKKSRLAASEPLAVRFNEKDMQPSRSQAGSSRTGQAHDVIRQGAPTPGVDDTPYIRFAIEQLTRDEEVRALDRAQTASSQSTYPVERIVPDQGLGYYGQSGGKKSPSFVSLPEEDEEQVIEPSVDVYVPVERPGDSYRHPALNFLPGMLRPAQLIILVLLSLLGLSATIASLVYSKQNSGFIDYEDARGRLYFIFEFLPPLIATIIILYIFSMQPAIYRIVPFIAMASQNANSRTKAAFLPLSPQTFLFPDVSYFKAGFPIIGVCMITFWISLFTVPLASALYQPQFIDGVWRWVTVQPVAYVLIVLYSLLTLSVVMLILFFFHRYTGLKFDPRTLADLIVLLQRSNSLEAYKDTETFSHKSQFFSLLNSRSNRLGYWTTTSRPNEVFYAIGEEGAPTRRYAITRGKVTEKSGYDSLTEFYDEEQLEPLPRKLSKHTNLRSTTLRYHYIPWYLSDSCIVLWAVLAIVLLGAFLIASNLHKALISGFRPLLPTAPDADGFSSSNFLYSFLPSLLGLILALFAWSLDFTFRALQPFANLASTVGGADAEHSLLLDYSYRFPIHCTLKALQNRDWKVAFLSALSLLSLSLPTLGGGLFLAQTRSTNAIVIRAHPTAFYILTAALVVYTLGICILWPARKRHLPHGITCLSEIISFLYKSPVVQDAAFREVSGRRDLVTRLVTPPLGELGIAGGRARWGFGVFPLAGGVGQGLGIDRVGRRGGGGVVGLRRAGPRPVMSRKEKRREFLVREKSRFTGDGRKYTRDGREIKRVTSGRSKF
ncbi:MAG: hypothetical protein M1814_000637 [Vezdaea aestivalis]|nr:MAG: hypothetical protein M1814_000637 [Vezdaea aestivalis]